MKLLVLREPRPTRIKEIPHWAALRQRAAQLTTEVGLRKRPLAADVLRLMSWLDYVETLLENQRIRRYLSKHHLETLIKLEKVCCASREVLPVPCLREAVRPTPVVPNSGGQQVSRGA